MPDRSPTLLVTAAVAVLLATGAAFAQPAATPTQPPAAKAAPTGRPAPSARTAREPTVGQMAARDRQKKCGAEWKTAKAAGQTGGTKWPQFWSKCNARLKGNAA